MKSSTIGSAVAAVLVLTGASQAQLAKDATKFLGNITTGGSIRSDFGQYWNQITPENESKWESIERNRDQMSWGGVDAVRDYAEKNKIPWKFHTLVWGSQYPSWIKNLSKDEQLAEIKEWFDEVAKRYPNVNMIDVVNEAHPNHAPAPFKDALGGDGSTGFDWIINSFKMARERWPKAILIYNDYNTCEYGDQVDWMLKLAKAFKAANAPVDAIGFQAHDAWKLSTATVKSNIDKIADVGYPIYITEYDIGQSDDAKQKAVMQEQFTMFWNHPKIAGVTYWGYIVGSTWRDGTGLKTSSGTERPALQWLKEYVPKNLNPTAPVVGPSTAVSPREEGINADPNRVTVGIDMKRMNIQFMKGGKAIDALGRH